MCTISYTLPNGAMKACEFKQLEMHVVRLQFVLQVRSLPPQRAA